ncbi:MAG: serine/threonine protein kinase [Firmicutes bacterium]|nr:serine/threonine protein kinase [Bacillota bacterium]
MPCRQCGHELAEGDAECPCCGLMLVVPQPRPAEQTQVICSCKAVAAPGDTYCTRCLKLLPVSDGASYDAGYVIRRIVGEGGMGRVYEATATGHPAAIKELLDHSNWSDAKREKYLSTVKQEIAILGSLSHLRTVPRLIESLKQWHGRHYFVMEFISGESLYHLLKRQNQPFPVAAVIRWGIQLCDVLHVLHRQEPAPIVHRDLKPDNILLRQDSGSAEDVVLLDFGVARFIERERRVSIGGTSGYMPKEQLLSNRPEPRSDLYALAATMHHLLTDHDPSAELQPFQPAHQLNPRVPEWLSELLSINLSEDISSRYESAAKFRDDLRNQTVTRGLICPQCGRENDRSLIYCARCAGTLLESSRQCGGCRHFAPVNALYCPTCGQEM